VRRGIKEIKKYKNKAPCNFTVNMIYKIFENA
jgi:hypothetical protein